jgi:predicted CxxxxCH...CXXCH cytochrome family protein
MNKSFVEAVLTVTMIILMSTAGHAAFAVPHNFQCDNCHGKFYGAADVTPNNACITCHSALGEAPRMPMEADTMSNFFGSASGQPATGSRSTHTWGATFPYNVAANVQEPLNAGLTSGYNSFNLTNKTLCIRCHNAKAGTNDVQGVDKPFLRVTNANDALCLDCHRARQTSTANTGSHPVAYRAYSTVYKSNTTAYRRTPVSANKYNPTANPGNYLSSGKVVCSTCHAPHYADSSSSTFGNRSTANGFAGYSASKGLLNQLQNSKGQLLRTDQIGATSSAINVCSSCHKETANLNHNGKGQNIQCDHCHGAHVDYTGDTSPKNIYLVRRDFSNMSTAMVKLGTNVKVIYNSVTTAKFKRTDGNGICQVCHATLPATVDAHLLAAPTKQDCNSCHKHSNGFSPSNCTSCHGQPPITSTVGGPNGKSSASYAIDESMTPHATHADKAYYNYACKNCHYSGTKAGFHNTQPATFQSVFVDTAGSVGELAGRKNVAGDYNSVTTRCSAVYCHSNGSPRAGSMAWKSYSTPAWQYGRNKILGKASECTTCHESGATLVTNAHYKHVTTNSMACSVCHAATVNNASAIIDRTKHADGIKEVVFTKRPANYFSVFSSSWNSVAGTCNNSCHSDGKGGTPITTPNWTVSASGACGSCHTAAPTSNLHLYHYSSSVGPHLGTASTVCANCHAYTSGATTHANGVVDLKGSSPCAPCHPGATPRFTVGTKVTCESCHIGTASVVGTFTAPLKNLNATLGHGRYSSATINVNCTSCHNTAAKHIGAGPTEKRLLVAGNGLCDTCHTTAAGKISVAARLDLVAHGGTANKFTHYTSASDLVNIANVRSDACAGCHDTHGTTNRMSIRTLINGRTISYATPSFITTVANGGLYDGLCQVCHTRTNHFRRNQAESAAGTGWNSAGTDHRGFTATTDCLSCHVHKGTGVNFAFAPVAGGCDGCHGYPPVKNMTGLGVSANYSGAKIQNYSGGGGAHSVAGHISKTAVASQAWTNCSNCHSSAGHPKSTPPQKVNVNVTVDPKFKFNNASTIKYQANTCSNVSCHFRPSPNWVTGN